MTQGRTRAREDKPGTCFAWVGESWTFLSYLALWPDGAIRLVS